MDNLQELQAGSAPHEREQEAGSLSAYIVGSSNEQCWTACLLHGGLRAAVAASGGRRREGLSQTIAFSYIACRTHGV